MKLIIDYENVLFRAEIIPMPGDKEMGWMSPDGTLLLGVPADADKAVMKSREVTGVRRGNNIMLRKSYFDRFIVFLRSDDFEGVKDILRRALWLAPEVDMRIKFTSDSENIDDKEGQDYLRKLLT